MKKEETKTIKHQKEIKKKEDNFDLVKKTKIRVIGIGGGGCNIVSEIISKISANNSLKGKASFVVANTDLQALKTTNKKAIRFPFGQSFTKGLGTGMDVELAFQAAEGEKNKIKKLFEGQDLCILISSLGGGTGSGATPVFAKIAKNLGVFTIGVFTLPFKFEGDKKLQIAKESLSKLKTFLNAIVIISNEKIFEVIDKKASLREALSSINKNLAESLGGLIETIYLPGLINIDFADIKAILQGRGRLAFLNTVQVEGENNLIETIKSALNSPFYFYNIKGAKGVILNIAKEKGLSLSELSSISKSILELINPEAKIIFGILENKKYKNKIKVTLLATGCTNKNFFDKTELKKETQKKETKKKPPIQKKKSKKDKTDLPKKEKPSNNSFQKIKIAISNSEISNAKPYFPEEKNSNHSSSDLLKDSKANFVFWKKDFLIRKNGLQLKKEMKEEEKEFYEKEAIWEMPAFLRKKFPKMNNSHLLKEKES